MDEVIKQALETLNNYNSFRKTLEEKKRYFGEVELFPSEIHTLVYLYEHKDDNFTELSKGLGITKGAFSKTVAKLEKKELIIKYYRENNQKSIYFKVTTRGEKAYMAHEAFHKTIKIELPDEAKEYFERHKKVISRALMYTDELINQLREEVEKHG